MPAEEKPDTGKSGMTALTIASIGIVYGDIGTSPLYAMRAIFGGSSGLILTPGNLLGIVSLIIWGLIVVVSLKYVLIMLRADNRGEGGALALMALAHSALPGKSRWQYPLLLLGVLGASLFYGDSVITPAISILSAVEGLEIAAPMFRPYVIPAALGIIVALYAAQRKGTGDIGKWFGPFMVTWFVMLAAMGCVNIIASPEVLAALNPWYAILFIGRYPGTAFIALSAVVLAFTGAETLYADMGHFGPRPIRRAWFMLIFPALILNYLGQGGLLLSDPGALANPFFRQLGSWAIYPLVFMSTIAVVIASQATISGAFSITKQAIGLGLLPRMKIIYTSESEMGQIYIPAINWLQMAAVIIAVLEFRSSGNLTGAYGVAVTGAMLITTICLFFIMRFHWKCNPLLSLAIPLLFGVIDVSLLTSNMLKIKSGGWFPIAIGLFICVLMMTWRRGRILVGASQKRHAIPIDSFLQSLFFSPPQRIPGTAVFLRGENDGAPQALLHNLSHNKVLHERVFFLTVHTEEVPWVSVDERVNITPLGYECYQIDLYYGFKDEVDIPRTLSLCKSYGYTFDMASTSFFISRQTLISTPATGMSRWREHLFIWVSRNARNAADYYQIPVGRVIELGARVEI
ncbi:MAG: potassium transporter Kup [Burkholderiaceae bacterium]|jgi:KUP system potassium uptake protein|nr:potassium transporter Kup [Burkholderiaceae bacterium]